MRLQAPQMLIAWVAALAQPDWVILLLILVFLLIVRDVPGHRLDHPDHDPDQCCR